MKIPLRAEAYRERGAWQVNLIGPHWVIEDIFHEIIQRREGMIAANFGGSNMSDERSVLLVTRPRQEEEEGSW